MKNEQTIKSILEAIEKAVDNDSKKTHLQENPIMDVINWFSQCWNDASPIVSESGLTTSGMTHGEAFRTTVCTILGFGGSFALAMTWDKVKAAIMKAPGKIKTILQAAKLLKKAKTEDEAKDVMSQFGADAGSITEARSFALSQLFEATKADKATFKQVSKGEGKGGAKQDNEIKGKKPAEKKTGEKAENWKDVDTKVETTFGSKPTEKKPQDASKDSFKKVGGDNKAKTIDTKPTFPKVKDGGVKGGAKTNVDDVKKK